MQKVMGPLPRRIGAAPEVVVLEETTLPKYVRKKITYLAENRDRVPAYLFIPTAHSGKLAAVLCLHQTTRIGKAPSRPDWGGKSESELCRRARCTGIRDARARLPELRRIHIRSVRERLQQRYHEGNLKPHPRDRSAHILAGNRSTSDRRGLAIRSAATMRCL